MDAYHLAELIRPVAAGRSRTILIAWDIGSGLGHLTSLMPLAALLRESGYQVVFAARERELSAAARAEIIGRVPSLHVEAVGEPVSGPDRENPSRTIIDVLHFNGFCGQEALVQRVNDWIQVVDRVRPGLVIADFAPCLVLACKGRIPVVVVGNGFTVPPAGSPLPAMAPWLGVPGDAAQQDEQSMLAMSRRVAARLGLWQPDAVSEMLRGHATFVFTHPAFDPYRAHRGGEQTFMPPNIELPDFLVDLEARPQGKVFAYLPPRHPLLPQVIQGLERISADAEIFVPGARGAVSGKIRLTGQPQRMASVLAEARVIIHHAGLAMAHGGLMSGTPQLTLPLALEHLITARGLQPYGMAACWPAESPMPSGWMEEALGSLLTAPETTTASRAAIRAFSTCGRALNGGTEPLVKICTEFMQ